jgi:hypothetical protein
MGMSLRSTLELVAAVAAGLVFAAIVIWAAKTLGQAP